MLGDLTRAEAVKTLVSIYNGSHFDSDKVWRRRIRSLTARPVDPHDTILLDVDGEAIGRLPCSIEVLPKSIKLKVA